MLSKIQRHLPTTAVLMIAVWTAAAGPASTEASLQSAAVAWDRGDYIAALTTYLQLLDSPAADTALDRIALQTGELYRTTELTTDGATPQFSPDGRRLLYETGIGLGRVTRLLPADGTTASAAELPGFGAVFSPDGSKIAYLKVSPEPRLTDAQAALDQASSAQRPTRLATLNQLALGAARIVVREIADGRETVLDSGAVRENALVFTAGGVLFSSAPTDGGPLQIYSAAQARLPVAITAPGAGDKVLLDRNATGTAALFTIRPVAGGQRGAGAGGAPAQFGLLSIADARTTMVQGTSPAFSGDGASFAYVVRQGNEGRVMVAATGDPANGTVVRKGTERVDAPALSHDGSRVAYQLMPREDWEIYTANRDGTG
jgi:Tol biopolymer transport system component